MCPGFVLICLACVRTRLPWVLDKVAASVEKEFGPSALYGKTNRAADLPCKHSLTFVHSAVQEGEVLGVVVAGDEVGKVATFFSRQQRRSADAVGRSNKHAGSCTALNRFLPHTFLSPFRHHTQVGNLSQTSPEEWSSD